MHPELQLVATLLRRGRDIDRLSTALSLMAVGIGLSPLLGVTASPLLALVCSLVLLSGLGEKYLALRVALDADLFRQLAAAEQLDSQTQSLDQALLALGLQKKMQAGRSWDARCQGALSLLRKQLLCLLLQLFVVLATVLSLPLYPPQG